MYTIWHDSDYDLACWILKHSCFNTKNVMIKQLPKTNSYNALAKNMKSNSDSAILPFIRYEHPDILVAKDESVLCVLEFMTHTPQWHHPLQRFARIYGAARMHTPSCLILPYQKTKLERKRTSYNPVKYTLSHNIKYLFKKTTELAHTPAQLFTWPDVDGYLKIDQQHPSAPLFEEHIKPLFDFINSCISKSVKLPHINNITFDPTNIKNVFIQKTSELITVHEIPESFHSSIPHKESCVFRPSGLSPPSSYFRTDPYAGMLCAFDIFYCLEHNIRKRIRNLVFLAQNISLNKLNSQNKFLTSINHDDGACPFLHTILDHKRVIEHIRQYCPYVGSKQERIYGQISDLIVFDDGFYQKGVQN